MTYGTHLLPESDNKTASVPGLAAQQAQLVSNHIRYSDVNSDKHDSFADTEMADKDSTDPVTKDPSGSQPPIYTGNVLQDLILRSNVDRKRLIALLGICSVQSLSKHLRLWLVVCNGPSAHRGDISACVSLNLKAQHV